MSRCEQCLTCDNWDCGVCNVCYPLPVITDGKCSSYYELKESVKRKGKKRKKDAEE